MIKSINDVIRDKIEKIMLDKEKSVIGFIEWYDTLSTDKQDYVMRLIISDFYKIICFMKDSENKVESLEYLEKEDINNIILSLEDNYKLLFDFLSSSIKFNKTTIFDKQFIFDIIKSKDNVLMQIFNGHILDKMTYSDKDNLNELTYAYKDYISKSEELEKFKIADCFLVRNLLKIRDNNYKLYKMYMLEFIKNFYKWKKFLFDNKKNILLYQEVKYLKFIEDNDIDDILEILNYNVDFLENIVGEYFYSKTIRTSKIIKNMEDYINNNIDEKQKKKFKI